MKQLFIDSLINKMGFRPHPDTVVIEHPGAPIYPVEHMCDFDVLPFNYIWVEDQILADYNKQDNATGVGGIYIHKHPTLDGFWYIVCHEFKYGNIGFFASPPLYEPMKPIIPNAILNEEPLEFGVGSTAYSDVELRFAYTEKDHKKYFRHEEIHNLAKQFKPFWRDGEKDYFLYSFAIQSARSIIYHIVNDKPDIELVEHSRQVRRHIKRKTGKEPSPYFTLIDNSKPRKVYLHSNPSQGKTDRKIHRVRGHIRTVENHPIEWFNGTRFIPAHVRGKGELSRSQYRVKLPESE